MDVQEIIVGVVVVLAAVYVFRTLAPRSWLAKLRLTRPRAGRGPGAGSEASCGCSSCPPARKPRQS